MVELRKRRLLTAVICSDTFRHLAQSQARVFGAPDLPLITIQHPLGGLSLDAVGGRAGSAIGQTVDLIRDYIR